MIYELYEIQCGIFNMHVNEMLLFSMNDDICSGIGYKYPVFIKSNILRVHAIAGVKNIKHIEKRFLKMKKDENIIEEIKNEVNDDYSDDSLFNISSWGADLSFREICSMV